MAQPLSSTSISEGNWSPSHAMPGRVLRRPAAQGGLSLGHQLQPPFPLHMSSGNAGRLAFRMSIYVSPFYSEEALCCPPGKECFSFITTESCGLTFPQFLRQRTFSLRFRPTIQIALREDSPYLFSLFFLFSPLSGCFSPMRSCLSAPLFLLLACLRLRKRRPRPPFPFFCRNRTPFALPTFLSELENSPSFGTSLPSFSPQEFMQNGRKYSFQ